MYRMLYSRDEYGPAPMRRSVEPVASADAALLDEVSALSEPCARGVDFLLRMLEEQQPDTSERVGLLAGRHELYGMRIDRCRGFAMVVSFDVRRRPPWPCTYHGVLPRGIRLAEAARARAAAHLVLLNPSWEPAR